MGLRKMSTLELACFQSETNKEFVPQEEGPTWFSEGRDKCRVENNKLPAATNDTIKWLISITITIISNINIDIININIINNNNKLLASATNDTIKWLISQKGHARCQ